MRIVFFGTPEFAVPSLVELNKSSHEVLAVVTQPDRAKNRKGEFVFGAVKTAAMQEGLRVLQFESVKKEGVLMLKDLNADIFVSAGYGQLFSQEIIDIAPCGIVNVHASLLPQYRGSSPIQWAIINGETRTGVTIMQTDIGLDSGDILYKSECDILPTDTTATLTKRLSTLGAEALLTTLDLLEKGKITRQAQNHKMATKFPLITKETGRLDFSQPSTRLNNLIRAIDCHTVIEGKYVKILQANAASLPTTKFKAGQICSLEGAIGVCCGEGILNILQLQPQNKRPMSATQYLLGHKIDLGTVIG